MLLTVTPNLCIERILKIPDFRVGAVHRIPPENLSVNAGGKGINAARVASQCGAAVLATSWVGKHQRAWFESELAREGLSFDLVEVESDTRICFNVVNEAGVKTEVVEAGNALSPDDGAQMRARFESLLPSAELVAICGSYPPGTPEAFAAHLPSLCALAKEHGKKILVDGKGVEFSRLLQSENLPWAIKPNSDEACAALGYPVNDENSEKRALADFLELGIEVILLSCGARGAYLGTRSEAFFFTPPQMREISSVGSGDSFVGAFAAQVVQNKTLAEAVSWGVAAGAANAGQVRSAFCTREEIEALLQQVKSKKVSL